MVWLDHPQAAGRRNRRRSLVAWKEINVVVGRVEIRVIEEIERVEVKAQAEALADLEFLGERGIDAKLKRRAEEVASSSRIQRFVQVASRCVARRTPPCPGARNCGPKSAAFRTGWPALMPVVPCNSACLALTPANIGTLGFVM